MKIKTSYSPLPRENYSEFQVKFLAYYDTRQSQACRNSEVMIPSPMLHAEFLTKKVMSEKQQLDGTPTATPFVNLLLDLRLW